MSGYVPAPPWTGEARYTKTGEPNLYQEYTATINDLVTPAYGDTDGGVVSGTAVVVSGPGPTPSGYTYQNGPQLRVMAFSTSGTPTIVRDMDFTSAPSYTFSKTVPGAFSHLEIALSRRDDTGTYSSAVTVASYYPEGHPDRPLDLTWIFNPFTGVVTFTAPTGSTVTRTDPVHGPVPLTETDNGDGTSTFADPWPPLNSDVEYVVTNPDSTTTTIVVDTTVEGPDGPGFDPLPRLSVPSMPALELPPVTLIEYTGAYPARNTVHEILDRTDPVVVQREPGLRRGELTYLFDDHATAMQIADAYRTGAKISLRQATHDRLDVVHIATGDVQITPEHGGLAWRLRVAYTEVAP